MSKSGKSAYFRHVFANNFFGTFLKTFSPDLKSARNSAFFDTVLDFFKKIFFLSYLYFFQTLKPNAQKTAQ